MGKGGLWVHNEKRDCTSYSLKHASELIKALPADIRDNYRAYELNGSVIIRRMDATQSDKLMYDGQKLIVDKGIFRHQSGEMGCDRSVSPSALRNVDIEAKGTKGNSGRVYDIAEDVRKTARQSLRKRLKQ